MYALLERARLRGHEKSLGRAIAYAAQGPSNAEQLALSMCGAVYWLAGVAPGGRVGVRSALWGLDPSRWGAAFAHLGRAARDASGKGNAAHHLAFALLAGLVDSRVIEVRRPSIAPLATAFRDRAVAFAEELTNTALGLTGLETEAASHAPALRVRDAALASQRLAQLAAPRAT